MSAEGRAVRILHLVPVDGIGGVEIAAKSVLAHPDPACNFHLLFIEPELRARRSGPLRLFNANRRAFDEAMAFDPDVIICSLWRSVPLALALREARRRTKLAFFVHNDVAMHAMDAGLSRLAIACADQVWGDSATTLAARGVPAARSRVISFVTDRLTAPARPASGLKPATTFVSWGRLHKQKGVDRSIRLIALLAGRGLDVRYDAYGPDGGALSGLQALAGELGVDDRVRFPGPVLRSRLPRIAAEHCFFLQLSRSEGMCMAAVEGMQLGLVPVATRVGEMAEYVRPGETGIAVDPDRLDTAADEIAALISNDGAWRSHSAAAVRYWQGAPLYAQDVCRAATELYQRG